MTSGTSEVEESSLSENNNTMSVWENPSVDLWLDVLSLDTWPVLETFHIDFVIEMSDISNNGVVLHLGHVLGHDDLEVTSGSNEDVGF